MPLWKEEQLAPGLELGVWNIQEPAGFFQENLHLSAEENEELGRLRGPGRRLEWLASRYLVHHLLSDEPEWDRLPLHKDDCGKPHIFGSPKHLSFSHSHQWAAVLLGERPVGIDIQVFVAKIGRLAPKFMRPEETHSLQPATELEHLHFYWGAKEALYKAYGRRELDWREHIWVEPFVFSKNFQTTGQICKDDLCEKYRLYGEQREDFFLVWCEQMV